ncbi:hypothetical protein AB0L13_46300 [Saccharopolyspora shandongensis]|uniref:hypothetical protein n=1 Tax=Saccharopolyspora shandongensis TaxID=418495 RepID=UPI0034245AD0
MAPPRFDGLAIRTAPALAVEEHVRHILTKLGLPETDETHRRVLAVITFLEAR